MWIGLSDETIESIDKGVRKMKLDEWRRLNEVAMYIQNAYVVLLEVIDVWNAECEEGMPDLSNLETVLDILSESGTTLENVLCDSSDPGHQEVGLDEEIKMSYFGPRKCDRCKKVIDKVAHSLSGDERIYSRKCFPIIKREVALTPGKIL